MTMTNQLSPVNIALLAGLAAVQSHSTKLVQADMAPAGITRQQLPVVVSPVGPPSRSPSIAQQPIAQASATADMLRSIMWNSRATFRSEPPVTHSIKEHLWFSDMANSLADIASEAEADGATVPSADVLKTARSALVVCSKSPVDEPAITHDDKGGIEIFFKNREKAIMIVVQVDGFIMLYGDDPDEQWRGRYKASGTAWKRHLSSHIAEVAAV